MTKSKIRFVNVYEKLLSLPIHDEEISLAHGQVTNEISLARCEKALAPGVGQWDLSGIHYFVVSLNFKQVEPRNFMP